MYKDDHIDKLVVKAQAGRILDYESMKNISSLTSQSTTQVTTELLTQPTTQAKPLTQSSTQSMTQHVTQPPVVLQKLKDLYESDMMVKQGIKMKWIIDRMKA